MNYNKITIVVGNRGKNLFFFKDDSFIKTNYYNFDDDNYLLHFKELNKTCEVEIILNCSQQKSYIQNLITFSDAETIKIFQQYYDKKPNIIYAYQEIKGTNALSKKFTICEAVIDSNLKKTINNIIKYKKVNLTNCFFIEDYLHQFYIQNFIHEHEIYKSQETEQDITLVMFPLKSSDYKVICIQNEELFDSFIIDNQDNYQNDKELAQLINDKISHYQISQNCLINMVVFNEYNQLMIDPKKIMINNFLSINLDSANFKKIPDFRDIETLIFSKKPATLFKAAKHISLDALFTIKKKLEIITTLSYLPLISLFIIFSYMSKINSLEKKTQEQYQNIHHLEREISAINKEIANFNQDNDLENTFAMYQKLSGTKITPLYIIEKLLTIKNSRLTINDLIWENHYNKADIQTKKLNKTIIRANFNMKDDIENILMSFKKIFFNYKVNINRLIFKSVDLENDLIPIEITIFGPLENNAFGS